MEKQVVLNVIGIVVETRVKNTGVSAVAFDVLP